MLTGEADKRGGGRQLAALHWYPRLLLIKWASYTDSYTMGNEVRAGHPSPWATQEEGSWG